MTIKRSMNALKASTHRAYQLALDALASSIGTRECRFQDLDRALAQFCVDTYSAKPTAGGRQRIVNAMSALVHRSPALANHFSLTRRSLCGWCMRLTPKAAAPMTKEVAQAFAVHAAISGDHDLGCCIYLAWAALLRANEVLQLRVADVALDGDYRIRECGSNTAGLFVRNAKTGPRQLALITDPDGVRMLRIILRRKEGAEKLFDVPYPRFLRGVRASAAAIGLEPQIFSCHSCRNGGQEFFFGHCMLIWL